MFDLGVVAPLFFDELDLLDLSGGRVEGLLEKGI